MVLQLDQVNKSSANGEISSLSSNSHSIQLLNQNVSLNEYQITHSISVFPIPTEKTPMISGLKPTQRIELINPLGQILYNYTVTENDKAIYELNMQDFDKGVYYIVVYTADKVGICKKILKD